MKRSLRVNEKGFTLVELLAAIVIMGILGLAMGGVLIQLMRSDRITNEMTAVRQVQAAGDRVSMDGLQAQYLTFGTSMTDSAGFLQLSWIGEWTDENGDYNLRTRSVAYKLVAAGEQHELHRIEESEWTIGTDDPVATDLDSVVAQHLEADDMSCEWLDTAGGDGVPDTETFAFRVVSTVGTRTEVRTYEITPRPAA
jgi:prepilin-type N-terminal cleavage/methylation domain-containing protein